ncbi:MAG: methionine--tRNA ligase [Pseudomonadales bacterium]|nr:methionine--tRNA ligase [Pseudomonadales bacterium]
MTQKNTFYITTTLPYVNAQPHIGFALEIVTADLLARYHQSLGEAVVFNTGTDEHGQKIYAQALESGKDPQHYVDEYAATFQDLKSLLNLSYTHFTRTTNTDHTKAAQEFWQRCEANGDIYKKNYQTLYCVGCELEKQLSELVDGKCPLHPTKELETREEENYFFRFSQYQDALLKLYSQQPDFVIPGEKQHEIASFVKGGLQDFSISRLKEKMPWGVPVPGDEDHVMYVWFDALVNYISALGWPHDITTFEQFWPGVQICGKDNLRQQSAMWQAMLLSANLPPSRHILVNGFISVDGQKMSKSLGNVISPTQMVERYGVDATRYLLMRLGPIGGDMDVSWEKFDTLYTAELANGVGNVCSRVAKLCEAYTDFWSEEELLASSQSKHAKEMQSTTLSRYDITSYMSEVWQSVTALDGFLSETKPWRLEATEKKKVLLDAVKHIVAITQLLGPIMPETARHATNHFSAKHITALKPLFPRLT